MAIEFPPQKQGETHSNELDELRDLLVGPERSELAKLKKRMDDPALRAMEISRILPEAIYRSSSMDRQFTKALNPVIEDGVRSFVKKYPQSVSNAIVPVLGTSIQEAISLSISKKISSINNWFIRHLSLKGLKWRLDAIKQRKSFDEIVKQHTLLYRVEQVFIIHKESGSVLQHVSELKDENIEEANMFSQTLKAIQGSHSIDKTSQDTLQVGDYTVWVEQGNDLMLAAVIRGTPSHELRHVFKRTLKNIEDEHETEIHGFNGDAAPFKAVKSTLSSCLQVEYGKEKESYFTLITLSTLIILGIIVWCFFNFQQNYRWNNYLELLRNENGIVVMDEYKKWGKFYISGMRDPIATNPDFLLRQANLDPSKVTRKWEPYNALHPEIVKKRAALILDAPKTVTFCLEQDTLYISGLAPLKWIQSLRSFNGIIAGVTQIKEKYLFDLNSSELFLASVGVQLEPPQTVSMRIESGVLYLSGSASHKWIEKAQKNACKIPGIVQLDCSNLINTDKNELSNLKDSIERNVILFRVDTFEPVPGQEKTIQTLISDIQQLNNIVKTIGKGHLEIVGHTDNTGSEQANLKLSQQRAEKILYILQSRGVDTRNLTAIGVGGKEPLRSENSILDREFNRSVTFRVLNY